MSAVEASYDRFGNLFFSLRSSVNRSLGLRQEKKGAFSSDGMLIAVHYGTKITLHDTIYFSFLCSVFEADYEFSVLQLTFSANSALLLYCVRNCRFVVWDVRKRATIASFDPPGLVSEDF